jgi:eukaryotic-like serine/threonine-protein kinase
VLKFITGRPLWANMLVGGAIFFILIFLLFQSMTCMTRHDKVLPVPSVTGRSYEEAKKLLEGQGFEVLVQDTAFSDTAPLSAVLNQFPEPETIVKMNRTVFLTINRAVPEIALQQLGLKIEDTIYRQDMARDMVLEQQFNGQRIKAGDKIAVGSKIVLVLGTGLGTETFDMPDLFGYTLSEAKAMLESAGLTIDNIVPQNASQNSYVYRQSPDHLSPSGKLIQVRHGQPIDLWVQPDKPVRAATTDTTAQQNAY